MAYETIKNEGFDNCLRKEPIKYKITHQEEKIEKKEVDKKKEIKPSDDDFVEVKSKKNRKKNIEEENELDNNDEGEWITPQNIDEKLNGKNTFSKLDDKEEEESPLKIYITTADFTVQNVAMKVGIPVLSIDGLKIKKIRNYILKCYTCLNFIFDTSKLFCENCGYNTLMKIGYSVNKDGKVKIYDKKAESRIRGTQVNT